MTNRERMERSVEWLRAPPSANVAVHEPRSPAVLIAAARAGEEMQLAVPLTIVAIVCVARDVFHPLRSDAWSDLELTLPIVALAIGSAATFVARRWRRGRALVIYTSILLLAMAQHLLDVGLFRNGLNAGAALVTLVFLPASAIIENPLSLGLAFALVRVGRARPRSLVDDCDRRAVWAWSFFAAYSTAWLNVVARPSWETVVWGITASVVVVVAVVDASAWRRVRRAIAGASEKRADFGVGADGPPVRRSEGNYRNPPEHEVERKGDPRVAAPLLRRATLWDLVLVAIVLSPVWIAFVFWRWRR